MRLMQVMAGGPHGGAEGFFERLALALRAPDIEQMLAFRRDAGRAARMRAAGLAVSEYRFGGRLDVLTPRRLRALARRFDPDVTLSWMSRGSRMAPAAPGVLAGRLDGYYKLKNFRHCHHLIAITPGIRDYAVQAGWSADRVHLIPNFVAAPETCPPESRAAHATPEEAPLLLALGRLHPVKGYDVLLHALARLPRAVLWIAGEGAEGPKLKALAQSLDVADRVRWLGWRQDVAPLFGAADLCVSSSRFESFGHVIVEAWAHGRAIVSTDVVGPAGTITPGENGLLVPKDSADALATAVQTLIDDPQRAAALAAAGQETFLARYSEPVVVEAYRDLFQAIAGV
ncbi:MAG: glycosyltransferase [Alphaproteobacteria bacterium]|nr:glycosyltransferase [Alphaproteobacteria bacterium]MCB9928689.1 glycosyltransferase [Alphaproteobacteria bacterium]